MSEGEHLRITIVSGFEIAREGLVGLLHDQGFEANATAALSPDQMAAFSVRGSSVVLFDSPVDTDIIATCRELRSLSCELRIVILCPRCTPSELQAAFAAGVDAVLDRSISPRALQMMLRLVESGEKLMPSPLVGNICRMMQSDRTKATLIQRASLSETEAEVLNYLVDGVSNRMIAHRTAKDEQVVKDLVRTILRKLKVLNRTQAAIWALEAGFLLNRAGSRQRDHREDFIDTTAVSRS